ncbi:hypothetical protein D3C78_1115780 [compost metagenome]
MVAVQVEHLVASLHPYLNVAVATMEITQSRNQPEAGERGGGRQGYLLLVAGGAQRSQCLVQTGQAMMDLPVQLLARWRQRYALGTALEQQQAQVTFQALDLVRDGCCGHDQLIGRSLETAQTGGGLKGAQGGQRQLGEHDLQPD